MVQYIDITDRNARLAADYSYRDVIRPKKKMWPVVDSHPNLTYLSIRKFYILCATFISVDTAYYSIIPSCFLNQFKIVDSMFIKYLIQLILYLPYCSAKGA